ncbi:3-keto-disaccharide hydrolase [Tautonia rosea]|uniref:3-keto-disaccharide hydrolase n=1 Tax=Tautonia rosea TaxID=2728037 RepID=UPI00147432DB|nr:DUF1080 domain-containing protein [Tautonia rosea]
MIVSTTVALATLVFIAPTDESQLNTPPEGFIALFNGTDLTHWKSDNDAAEHWTVKDGILHYDGKGNSLVTAKDYGDIELYVDWKIGPKADSGIYLRGKPQVQIWDEPEIGSGGLFNNKVGESKPLVVADKPIGEWNTFHIIMKGEKVTVFLNGEKVVDDVALENWPNYDGPIPAKGTVELQHHGNPLEFRNIYLKELD